MNKQPQQDVQGAMDREIVQDHNQVTFRPEGSDTVQKVKERRAIARISTMSECQSCRRFQCAKRPDFGAPAIIRGDLGALSHGRPARGEVGLGADGPHLIDTQHMGFGRRRPIQRYDRPLFSANWGSGRSVKYVFSWYHRNPSAVRTRASCAIEMPISSSVRICSCRRWSVQ